MAKDDMIELEGVVTESLPNTTFHVDIGNGHIILAHISGKLRMNFIRILPGDKVTVQMSPYDLTRGRITWQGQRPQAAPKRSPAAGGFALERRNSGVIESLHLCRGEGYGACFDETGPFRHSSGGFNNESQTVREAHVREVQSH